MRSDMWPFSCPKDGVSFLQGRVADLSHRFAVQCVELLLSVLSSPLCLQDMPSAKQGQEARWAPAAAAAEAAGPGQLPQAKMEGQPSDALWAAGCV